MKATKNGVSSKRIRTSVSISLEDYREIEDLAAQKKVSVAWVVRDAVEQYLAKRRPLLSDR